MDFIRTRIEQLLNLGINEDLEINLYHVQVINLSYLCTIGAYLLSLIPFILQQVWLLVAFDIVTLAFFVFGLYLNIKGQRSHSALLYPIVLICAVVVKTLVFLGVSSQLHWLLLIVGVFVYTAFHAELRVWRPLFVLMSALAFVFCDRLGLERGELVVTPEGQRMVQLITFTMTLLAISIATSLVVGRLRRLNDHLRTLAEVDELTGLSNRRKVLADAVNIFADAVINQEPLVFAIIDLDHFKKINDTYGHEAGDLVLTQVASGMQKCIRLQDKIGRYGGEEFIIIMPNTDLPMAHKEMERLRQTVCDMVIETDKGIMVPVTLSIGLSAIGLKTTRYEEILAEADKALYQAKRDGRNRVCSFSNYQNYWPI